MRRLAAILTLVLVCASLLGVAVSAEDSALEGMNAETTAPKTSFSDIDWRNIKWSEIDWTSVDWVGLIEDKVIPVAIEGFIMVISLYISARKSRGEMQSASQEFKVSAKNNDESTKIIKSTSALFLSAKDEMSTFQKDQNERMTKLEKQQAEEIALMRAEIKAMTGEMKAMTGEMTRTKEMLRLGFSNVDELVEKGVSREIVKLTEDGNGKETA